MDQKTVKTIKSLPKVELHRHLEGCISAELLLQIAREYEVKLPTRKLEELRPLIQVKGKAGSLKDFLDKFYWLGMAFPTLEAVERVAYYVCRDCSRDNIRYVEIRFSPLFMSLEIHHSWEELLHAVLKGTRRAEKEFDIETGLIVGVSRSNPLKHALRVVAIAC
jgi:adenosine deaminase